MAKIRGEDIRALPIPAAPKATRVEREREFARVEAAAEQGRTVLTRSDTLFAELKRSLITAAVAGEFDVSSTDGSRVSA